ncbi:hypothetical protein Y88_0209 [Novosphingobium nitrogenifigens DSM 19370]|uniref:Uncharacterized protein n=1 Tax=Novosphingobium nitrogenifigens DSM 19370 TaxID=983920 RepID=F1ZBE5_9SPHN|nr:hypothetical protein [Novosphingobium nitrogenifigens]EGD58157.1 hypothetical protein Y88_0209 [Novosphingobium nitrogenifigens DSM 19370]
MLARKHGDMAMTNAERQRRYRQKLKARASGDALGDRVREASDRAVAALWAFHERPAPGGVRWSDIDGCTTLDDYLAELQRSPGNLVEACYAFVPDFEGLTEEEARAIRAIIDIADAVQLAPVRTSARITQPTAFAA